jgi:hypothetical protein
MQCTGVTHKFGDGGGWNARLRFRVPRLRPGLYQFLVYCDPCHPGPGGNLISNNWLLHDSGRRSFVRQGFRILPPLS